MFHICETVFGKKCWNNDAQRSDFWWNSRCFVYVLKHCFECYSISFQWRLNGKTLKFYMLIRLLSKYWHSYALECGNYEPFRPEVFCFSSKIFTEDLPEVEGLPRDKVLAHIEQCAKQLTIRYLVSKIESVQPASRRACAVERMAKPASEASLRRSWHEKWRQCQFSVPGCSPFHRSRGTSGISAEDIWLFEVVIAFCLLCEC